MRKFMFLGAAVLAMSSCAKSLGEVDATSTQRVQKSLLEGEFYMSQTVTDIQSAGSYATGARIGSKSDLKRVRFVIDEKFLYAISADEWKPGLNQLSEKRELDEHLVGIWPINSHFNVNRQLSASTNEQTNIIIHDTSRGKWFEREYMSVNWAANSAKDLWLNLIHDLPSETADVNLPNPNWDDPYRLELSEEHIGYETEFTLTGYTDDIRTSRAKVYTSILRVPENDGTGYQPFNVPPKQRKRDAEGNLLKDADGQPIWVDAFERYGIFQTIRENANEFTDVVEGDRTYFAQRFNMFEAWAEADGTPIPLQQRTLKPIVYFVAEDYPDDMLFAAQKTGEILDSAFKKALLDVGFPLNITHTAFEVCENPVTSASSATCRKKVNFSDEPVLVLFGDLRYNFLKLALPGGAATGLLGFGPSNQDVRTGETINAYSVSYFLGVNLFSKRALDMVKIMNNEVSEESLDWLVGDYYQGFEGSLKELMQGSENSDGEMAQNAMQNKFPDLYNAMGAASLELANNPELQALMKKNTAELSANLDGRALMQHAAERLKDVNKPDISLGQSVVSEGFIPEFETESERDEFLSTYEKNPASAVIGVLAEQEKQRIFETENTMFKSEFLEPTLISLARKVSRKYAGVEPSLERDEKILKEIRDGAYISLMLHEVGHNLGLRHNFAASTDEVNYVQPGPNSVPVVPGIFPAENPNIGYWDLATQAGGGDPSEKLDYQYSSIMDYGSQFGASQQQGLGSYDVAALRFSYFGYIEAFSDGSHPSVAGNDYFNSVPRDQFDYIEYQKRRSAVINKPRVYVPWDPNAVITEAEDESLENTGLEKIVSPLDGAELYINKHRFCSDTFADGWDTNCTLFDAGNGPGDIVGIKGNQLRANYWFLNHRRGRNGSTRSTSFGITNVILSSYFGYVSRLGLLASYYQWIYGVDAYTMLTDSQYSGISVLTQWAGQGLNEIVNTIMTPDSDASYRWDPSSGAVVNSTEPSASDFKLPSQDYARPMRSKFGETPDPFRNNDRFGYENNRLGAMISMFLSFGVDFEQFSGSQLQGAGNISLAAAFPAETAELVAGLIIPGASARYAHLPAAAPVSSAASSEDQVASISAMGDAVSAVVPRDRILTDLEEAGIIGNAGTTLKRDDLIEFFIEGGASPEEAASNADSTRASFFETGLEDRFGSSDAIPTIPVNFTWNEYVNNFNFAMYLLYNDADQRWRNYMRVGRLGDARGHDFSDPSKIVTFEDDATGIIWEAYDYEDIRGINGRMVDPSIGARFLNYVNASVSDLEAKIAGASSDQEEADAQKELAKFLELARARLDVWYFMSPL